MRLVKWLSPDIFEDRDSCLLPKKCAEPKIFCPDAEILPLCRRYERTDLLEFESSGYLQASSWKSGDRLSKEGGF